MTTFVYNTDLAQFVSDYYQIDGARKDSDKDIAEAYIESCLTEPTSATIAELEFEVERLKPQIAYYR